MKCILMGMLCLFWIQSFGQTKKETEDWLTYYLNKYFYYEDESTYPYSVNTYEYVFRQFFFRGKNLVAIAETYQWSEGKEDSLIKKYIETVDLSKVIKIASSKQKDSVSYLAFDCFQNGPQTNHGVIRSNTLNINDDVGAYDNSYKIYSKFKETKNLLPRLIRALNHLVVLNNGKPLKEVF